MSKNGSSAGGKAGAGRGGRGRVEAGPARSGARTFKGTSKQKGDIRKQLNQQPEEGSRRIPSKKEERLSKISTNLAKRREINTRKQERVKAKQQKDREKAKKAKKSEARKQKAALFTDLSKKARSEGNHAHANHLKKAAQRLRRRRKSS